MAHAVLLDLDGTLVDTAYLHVLAWQRAFRASGCDVPAARIHRAVGMGADRLVPALVGDDADRRLGDAVRAAWRRELDPLLDTVRPLPGARALLDRLAADGVRVGIASSAPADHLERYLALLGRPDLAGAATTGDDVDASKPAPDIVAGALARAGGAPGVLVGDATWDCLAAGRLGLPTVGVTLGGYARAELAAAGAVAVVDRLEELVDGAVDLAALAAAAAPSA